MCLKGKTGSASTQASAKSPGVISSTGTNSGYENNKSGRGSSRTFESNTSGKFNKNRSRGGESGHN